MIEVLVDRVVGNPAVLASLVVLGVYYLANFLFFKKKVDFETPLLHDETKLTTSGKIHELITGIFQDYKKKFYSVLEPHGKTIMLPVDYIEELKALPNDVCSFMEVADDQFLGKYSLMSTEHVGGHSSISVNSVKNELTRSLGVLMGDIYDEMLYAFETELPACDDWTEVDIQYALVRIVALVSGKIFIGNPMNRNEDYLKCIIMFTLTCFNVAPAMRKYPAWSHPIMQYFSPEVKAVNESLDTMERLMRPVIEENISKIDDGTAPRNMNTWNMTNSDPAMRRNVRVQAHLQLGISMAAIHTTSMTATQALYELAEHQEYLEPLRQELAEVKATETTPYLSKVSMPKLKKLDSFVKESQRVNPLSVINFRRKILKDVTLHDGKVLPAGTYIAVASGQVARDPELWESPDKFDGFRFEKLRKLPGHENKHQFVTTGLDSLMFGHGTHACPGRFFANNEIKLIFVHLFENYDLKFPEEQGRPKNIFTPGGIAPGRGKLLLKKRVKA